MNSAGKKVRKFFTVNFIEKTFRKLLIVNFRLLKNFLLLNSLQKKFENFLQSISLKNISKFFRKSEKKFLPKKNGITGGKMQLCFQQNPTRPLVGFWCCERIARNSIPSFWKKKMKNCYVRRPLKKMVNCFLPKQIIKIWTLFFFCFFRAAEGRAESRDLINWKWRKGPTTTSTTKYMRLYLMFCSNVFLKNLM